MSKNLNVSIFLAMHIADYNLLRNSLIKETITYIASAHSAKIRLPIYSLWNKTTKIIPYMRAPIVVQPIIA